MSRPVLAAAQSFAILLQKRRKLHHDHAIGSCDPVDEKRSIRRLPSSSRAGAHQDSGCKVCIYNLLRTGDSFRSSRPRRSNPVQNYNWPSFTRRHESITTSNASNSLQKVLRVHALLDYTTNLTTNYTTSTLERHALWVTSRPNFWLNSSRFICLTRQGRR